MCPRQCCSSCWFPQPLNLDRSSELKNNFCTTMPLLSWQHNCGDWHHCPCQRSRTSGLCSKKGCRQQSHDTCRIRVCNQPGFIKITIFWFCFLIGKIYPIDKVEVVVVGNFLHTPEVFHCYPQLVCFVISQVVEVVQSKPVFLPWKEPNIVVQDCPKCNHHCLPGTPNPLT